MKVLGEKENKGGRMVAGAEEEKFVYKKVWLGDETDGNVVATWNREMSACVHTCLCAQVCVCVYAHAYVHKCVHVCAHTLSA